MIRRMPASHLCPPNPALSRRQTLQLLGGSVGGLLLGACSSTTDDSKTTSTCLSEIPEESAGPYPADGSQADIPNVLDDARIFRSDIRHDIEGDAAQDGTLLDLTLRLNNLDAECGPLAQAAVYIWHGNADGEYSAYTSDTNGSHSGNSFLRGVQVADSSGQVRFRTIYPGRHPGRATHIHVAVYADSGLNTLLKTTQLAFDEALNAAIYDNDARYVNSAATARTDNAEDTAFADGYARQLPSFTSTSEGVAASLTLNLYGG